MRMSQLLNEVWEIEEKLLSERVTSTAFRKKTARVNPMVKKDIERMIGDRKYKGNTSGLMKDIKKKFPDEYESDIVQDMMRKHAETNEAVSPAQQAAIAISKKEKAGKPGYDKEGKSLKNKKEELGEAKESVIDIARRVVDNKGAEKVKGVMLDTFTASAIVQVYDKVNDSNKKKMESMDLPKLAAAVWKILGKAK